MPVLENLEMLLFPIFAVQMLPELSTAIATGPETPPPVKPVDGESGAPVAEYSTTLSPSRFAIHALPEASMAMATAELGLLRPPPLKDTARLKSVGRLLPSSLAGWLLAGRLLSLSLSVIVIVVTVTVVTDAGEGWKERRGRGLEAAEVSYIFAGVVRDVDGCGGGVCWFCAG